MEDRSEVAGTSEISAGCSSESPRDHDDDENPLPASSTAETTADSRPYGRFNPENEDNLHRVDAVSDDGVVGTGHDRHNMITTSPDDDYYPVVSGNTEHARRPSQVDNCYLFNIPNELIDAILSYLSPSDLVVVLQTCRKLKTLALADVRWQALVQANVPGVRVTSSYPCDTFRDLYRALDPHWFLPRYKIWFCDWDYIGRVLIVRYDQRRGCIEGYQLLAIRDTPPTFTRWAADEDVIIHAFQPSVSIHLDRPMLQLNAGSLENLMRLSREPVMGPLLGTTERGLNRFQAEVPMLFSGERDARHSAPSQLSLASPLADDVIAKCWPQSFRFSDFWPPPAIPARHRVSRVVAHMDRSLLDEKNIPTRRSEMSEQAFRIRRWHDFQPLALDPQIITYSTLDPSLYTPTPEKPWRGIWVGDYSGHGCEFLLIHQPDDEEQGDAPAEGAKDSEDKSQELEKGDDETAEEFAARQKDAKIYRGRLEAIKLTGDPNVPRGEYSFVAEDLGEKGFVCDLKDPPFAGARMVKSKGHIAGAGFTRDKYIESRLILLSYDRLAQYWLEFGHISYFVRADIDQFLGPK